ncbi:MAG: ABC transporter ATP-binding protein, partial [Clostridia bacterium]|nr:ABC transporter ATP-binding protein [Clostridia bacterium]
LVVLVSFNPVLTLIIFLTALTMAILNRLAWNKMRRNSKAYLSAEKKTAHHITDTLHGSEAIKMYSIEDEAIDRFEGHLGTLRDTGLRHSLANSLEGLKVEFAQYFGIGVVYLVGGLFCVLGRLEVGELYLFLSTMTTILGILNSWLGVILTQNTAAVALDHVAEIIEEQSTTPEVKENARRAIEIERASAQRGGKPCVSFKDVTFAYDNKPIFRGLSCDIGYGESIGLVGGSGSGKSTFTKLMMRLYEVDEGAVLVHDRNVKDYETHELRLSFGVVPQNPYIFYGTVWDNIRIVRPSASNKEIIDAMELARVHEFVNELPKGWSTMIGDGALGLSGGQKQRIAIARAILKKPDVFIFDEATSALDNVSERLIQAAMEDLMKSHTVVMVAHRLSTIKGVDRILVFDKGEIVEEGNYETLAAKESGPFRTLLDAAEGKGEYENVSLSTH